MIETLPTLQALDLISRRALARFSVLRLLVQPWAGALWLIAKRLECYVFS